jgi:hypothetical protein
MEIQARPTPPKKNKNKIGLLGGKAPQASVWRSWTKLGGGEGAWSDGWTDRKTDSKTGGRAQGRMRQARCRSGVYCIGLHRNQ